MNAEQHRRLFEMLMEVLEICNPCLLQETDEMIGYLLFENFDVAAHTALYPDNLAELRAAHYISEEAEQYGAILREEAMELLEGPRDAHTVRSSPKWKELLERGAEFKELVLPEK